MTTHTAELTASVAMMLLKLKADFLATAYPKSESYTADQETAMLDEYLSDLIQRMQETIAMDAELATAWDYMQKQLAAATDDWDKVSYWQPGTDVAEGESIELTIALKETLALVFAALSDKDRFWNDMKTKIFPNGATQKDIITLRGKFEADYEKDLAARLLTLCNTFKTLQRKNVCHTGIRNDLAMVLNGVYPGVWLVEDFKGFLWSSLEEYLKIQIESFRDSNGGQGQLYRDVLLGEISQERHEALATQLKDTTKLKQTISERCEALGINPNEARAKKAIEDYSVTMPEVFLPWANDEDVLIRSLSEILAPSIIYGKVDDEVLLQVKAWIKEYFALDNAAHKTQVIDFARVKQCDELFKQFHVCLRTWDSAQLAVESIDKLAELLETYRASCLAEKAPLIASEELKRSIETFATACQAFQKDQRKDWVENVFVNWFKLTAEGIEPVRPLFAELRQPLMQAKYQVTDAFLESLFNRENTDIYLDLTPYLINRIFLHAITVHPKEWSVFFASCLQTVCEFVLAGFPDSRNPQLAAALKEGSYPDTLLQQIQYMLDYSDYLNTEGSMEPEEKDLVAAIPMPHLVISFKDAIHTYQFLMGDEKTKFLNGTLKSMITDVEQLKAVLDCIYDGKKNDFLLNGFSIDFFKNIITDVEKLVVLLGYTDHGGRSAFLLKGLGLNFLKSIITDGKQLAQVLSRFMTSADLEMFMRVLDSDFLTAIIKDVDQLKEVVESIRDIKDREAFLSCLDRSFLQTIIKDISQVKDILKLVKTPSRTYLKSTCLDSLDGEFLAEIFKKEKEEKEGNAEHMLSSLHLKLSDILYPSDGTA